MKCTGNNNWENPIFICRADDFSRFYQQIFLQLCKKNFLLKKILTLVLHRWILQAAKTVYGTVEGQNSEQIETVGGLDYQCVHIL